MNTPTIKKILVAIDFSESARAAFYAALDLAVKYDVDTYRAPRLRAGSRLRLR